MSLQKGTNMKNLAEPEAFRLITIHMRDSEGWDQVGSNERHWIKKDIWSKLSQCMVYWPTVGEFCLNYENWVHTLTRLHVSHESDKTDMWNFWADMLKDVYLGR